MLEYRKASLADIDAVTKARVDFLYDAGNITNNEDEDIIRGAVKSYIEKSLADGSFVEWIAVEDDNIIATSGISFYLLPPNSKNLSGSTAYISNMFTYPNYRRLGIATKLFALTVDEAKSRGCSKIMLDATDMGRPIYEKYGFKDTDSIMVYYIQK